MENWSMQEMEHSQCQARVAYFNNTQLGGDYSALHELLELVCFSLEIQHCKKPKC